MSEPTIDQTLHAFPFTVDYPDGSSVIYKGMQLRDYFAAKAMQTLLMSDRHIVEIPEAAYAYADAMLAERSK